MEGKWLSEQGVRLGLEGGSTQLNSTRLSSRLVALLSHQLAAQLSPRLAARLSSQLAARVRLGLLEVAGVRANDWPSLLHSTTTK